MNLFPFIKLREKVTEAISYHVDLLQPTSLVRERAGILLYESMRFEEQFAQVGIGTVPDMHAYRLRARMKIIALKVKPRYISSFECRDLKRGIYGGGIHVQNVGSFAIYGLNEYIGEACLLYGLKTLDIVDEQYIETILMLSNNRHQTIFTMR